MTRRNDQEALLVRYLLGMCTEEERARVEEKYFSEHQQFDQLLALEDSLIDDYVSGRLPAPQREAFKKVFSSRTEDIRFSRALIEELTKKKLEPSETVRARPDLFQVLMAVIQSSRFGLAAFVISILLLVVSVGLFTTNRTLRNELAQSKAANEEISARAAAAEQERDEARDRLAKAPQKNPLETQDVQDSLDAHKGTDHLDSAGYTPLLITAQLNTRGSENDLTKVNIRQNSRGLALTVPLETSTQYDSYRVSLKEPGKRDASINRELSRSQVRGKSLTARFERKALKAGTYIVEIQGEQQSKPPTKVGRSFQIHIVMN